MSLNIVDYSKLSLCLLGRSFQTLIITELKAIILPTKKLERLDLSFELNSIQCAKSAF